MAVLVVTLRTLEMSRVMIQLPRLADDPVITREAFAHGLAMCRANNAKAAENPVSFLTGGPPKDHDHRHNPRHAFLLTTPLAADWKNGGPVLIRNATVWDGTGRVLSGTDLVLSRGLIVKLGRALTRTEVAAAVRSSAVAAGDSSTAAASGDDDALLTQLEIVDAGGRVVTPGLVDQHSHVGTFPFPLLTGSLDTNEDSTLLHPQLRVLDAIGVLDPAFDVVLSGGVTSSLVLPGSSTLMGGEGLAVKMLRTGTNQPEHLATNFGMREGGADGKPWRWMKMACGENPKSLGAEKGKMPDSRMGNGWMFRKHFEAARAVIQSQEDWCEGAALAEKRYGPDAHLHVRSRFPEPLAYESLTALLRGDVRLQVHCYDPQDIEMMVRNTHEFGFNVTTFHHATEAHLVAPLLARENISVAIFADYSLYKHESYVHSVRAGQIFRDAGVRFAYKSDHPVLNSQTLIFEAQKAVHYGLDPQLAFAAVTSVPAERMGLGWRIGRIAEAYDADVVIWDRSPMELGAHPLRVFVDGFTALSKPFLPEHKEEATPVPPVTPALDEPADLPAYTIFNVSTIIAGPGHRSAGKVVVRDGVVVCVGPDCENEGAVFNAQRGVVMPGMVVANTMIGLGEIDLEPITQDGLVDNPSVLAGLARAADGLRVDADQKHLQYAFRHGVLTAISAPLHRGMLGGISVAFRTGAKGYNDAIIKEEVAMHVTIGNAAKDSHTASVTTQIGLLRRLLDEGAAAADSATTNASVSAAAAATHPFARIASGAMPLVSSADDPSDLAKLLALATARPRVRLVLTGAAGAWSLVDDAAAATGSSSSSYPLAAAAAVLLQPPRCMPVSWDARACRPPYARPTAAELLLRADDAPPLAVAPQFPDQARSLRFDAGWLAAEAVALGSVTLDDAVGAATWAVADAFGLAELGVGRVAVGTRANLLVLDAADPGLVLSLNSTLQLIGDGKRVVTQPVQD
ncbi:hypothetical protein HK405_001494 [Cladochytrium tenue]|nr:hypothetical protein HK405_001494 [Cladochytrium tenue]